MKIAIFGDIHGNLIALNRFIEVTISVVDKFICIGDIVNYGPWNDECLELIYKLPDITIIEGNHEKLFLGQEPIKCELPLVQEFFQKSFENFSRVDLIKDLKHDFKISNYMCAHTINNLRIYQNTDIQIEITNNFIIGHTHHQFSISKNNYKIINTGSIGQNRNFIDLAQYLILDTTTDTITFHSVQYDIEKFIYELTIRDYSKNCISYYQNKKRSNK